MKPLVYDIGMNEGRNLPYYLLKGYRVVAVDAAPHLVDEARKQFADAVESGDLKLLNVGISDTEGHAPFYVNTEQTIHSSFVAPTNPGPEWVTVDVPTMRVSQLLREHGEPDFLKIDVEGYDLTVLLDLLSAGIKPPLISAEAHTIDVLCALVTMGYQEFHLLNGREIGRGIARRMINTVHGEQAPYLFPKHSAGPFGDDLDEPWLNAEAAVLQWIGRYAFHGRGWFDVHARG